VYAWYFDAMPPHVPTAACHAFAGLPLLYVGISPKAPPRDGSRPSRQTIRSRIRYHYRGNAAGSTLRLTLGSLLASELGLALRRVGSGKRMTFTHEGESLLSAWMAKHARVAWAVAPSPSLVEAELIRRLALPLNLDQNRHGAFHATLSELRGQQRDTARQLTVLPDRRHRGITVDGHGDAPTRSSDDTRPSDNGG
jgi:hypothetical protein